MTVQDYERIGELVSEIRRSKSAINRNQIIINDDYEELDELIRTNNLERIKLEDIKTDKDHFRRCREF